MFPFDKINNVTVQKVFRYVMNDASSFEVQVFQFIKHTNQTAAPGTDTIRDLWDYCFEVNFFQKSLREVAQSPQNTYLVTI